MRWSLCCGPQCVDSESKLSLMHTCLPQSWLSNLRQGYSSGPRASSNFLAAIFRQTFFNPLDPFKAASLAPLPYLGHASHGSVPLSATLVSMAAKAAACGAEQVAAGKQGQRREGGKTAAGACEVASRVRACRPHRRGASSPDHG